jgi:transcription elongation factor Elf1
MSEVVIQCLFCASDKIVDEKKVKESMLDIVDDCPVCGISSVFLVNVPATQSLNGVYNEG